MRRRLLALLLLAGAALCLFVLGALLRSGAGDPAADEASGRASLSPRPPAAAPPPNPLAPRAIRATGRLVTVLATRSSAPGAPTSVYAVEVEQGVELDRAAFAREVERTLGDRRGWSAGGRAPLRRTDADGDPGLRVTLASPPTTDELCRPLLTRSIYSCYQAGRAVLNAKRWARGARAFGDDLDGYRRYMINHEVGHALGQGHQGCPVEGRPAPVMMQQTKGVGACRPNPWPLEVERGSGAPAGASAGAATPPATP